MQLNKQKKQVFLLYGSTLLGVLLSVFVSVINTGALVPAQYGDVKYVQNIISFVSSLLLLGYFVSGSRLLAISKTEEESRSLRGVMCIILLVTISIVMLVMVGLSAYSGIRGMDDMARLYMVAAPVCGNVLMLSYINTVSQGDNHIGRIAAGRLLPSAVYCLSAFFIYKHFRATPVMMLALYNGIGIITLGCVIMSTRPSFTGIKSAFKILNEENRNYGFDVYLGSLVNVSTGYISGITLGIFCNTNTEVGFYSLAYSIATPLSMLPSVIGTTYFKQFASQNRIDKKVLLYSILLTVTSFFIFIAIVGIIVDLLYEDSYTMVSRYASFLAIGTSMHGLGDMFNRFLGAHGQGKMLRNGAFVCGFLTIVGSFLFVYIWNINGAILTKVLGSSCYMVMMTFYYLKYTRTNSFSE